MPVKYEVRMGPEGRVLIPAEIRRAVGLEPGERIVVRVEGDRIVLLPREAIKRQLQDPFKDVDGSMSEELIAERRKEAARESGKT